jgi:hypothetical protein
MCIQLIWNSPELDASSTVGIERPQVDVLATRKKNNIFFGEGLRPNRLRINGLRARRQSWEAC